MKVNEDAEVATLRWQVSDLQRRLDLARKAIERGCSLTPRERGDVLGQIRPGPPR